MSFGSLLSLPFSCMLSDMYYRVIELDQTLGTLRWNDLPDPASSRPVSSRLTVGIEDEKNLLSIMRTINHR